jgi:hypothetical protein
VVLLTSEHKYFVTDVGDAATLKNYTPVTRSHLIKEFKKFEDPNYKIYFKQMEQPLVGYLLDFFIYYVEMPDKIITDSEDNIEIYKRIKKDKLFK